MSDTTLTIDIKDAPKPTGEDVLHDDAVTQLHQILGRIESGQLHVSELNTKFAPYTGSGRVEVRIVLEANR